MRLVIISDTHGQHRKLGRLHGDVLIHCGDIAMGSRRHDSGIAALDAWFGEQDFRLILCIGGNHDFALQRVGRGTGRVFRHAHYLEDESYEFEGVKFHGAPWVPELQGWAYFREPTALARHWAGIPADTDVLITHTPPRGILDRNSGGRECGCVELRAALGRIAPRVHCFGHVHAGHGTLEQDGTTFVNAALVNRAYKIVRGAVSLELPVRRPVRRR